MRLGKRFGIAILIGGATLLVCSRGLRETQAHEASRFASQRAGGPYVGVPSCSARSCHGADGPAPTGRLLRNEYTQWIEQDPHAAAYTVLFGDRAARIMKNLATLPGTAHPAYQDIRCLACHCEPHIAVTADLAGHRVDGVVCEACHGTARNWLERHTAAAVWDKLPASEKLQFGMTNVKDPAAMSQVCVGCHVGAPADENAKLPLRDVDHDLLAAGHPRLNFEFATFMANLPPHWKQAAGSPDARRRESAKPWAVGQLTSARAALALLADRATRAATATWPEFAEYDCSSCHHALTSPSARRHQPGTAALLGRSSWGNWFLSMPEQILADDANEINAFAALRKHMERPYPPLAATARLVQDAAKALSRMQDRFDRLSDDKVASRAIDKLQTLKPPANLCCWELAEQRSLSAALLERARSGEQHPNLVGADSGRPRSAAEEAIFGRLAFPQGLDGQGAFYWDDKFDRDLRVLLSAEPEPK